MINWEYNDYRYAGFECYEAQFNTHYKITVTKLVDNGTSYSVRWYYKDMTDIKKHIDADDWDKAKEAAINIVYDYIDGQANYWHTMRDKFEDWAEVD